MKTFNIFPNSGSYKTLVTFKFNSLHKWHISQNGILSVYKTYIVGLRLCPCFKAIQHQSWGRGVVSHTVLNVFVTLMPMYI